MYRLVYTSRSAADLSADDINMILNTARRRNADEGITGLLLYHNRMILQVLEGEKAPVKACYDRIRRDPRHRDVWVRMEGEVDTLFFTDWFMGYEQPEALPALGRVAAGKSLITLDQLKSRLSSVNDVQTEDHKQAVIDILKRYLITAQYSERASA
ncbi:Blue light-and temperature-regulated antirepressor YcgF [Tritonibacter multivorans]|uniref:Blue light-and temperature-regulated antirepressor YcgF n=1 Tax=Tritonibacter multivorans TaxID=928856 RepID=A0A0P1GYB8_9RHOB|nr:BLUF domain-containing protein [Tritonibacter multivorans]MDA7419888.1 BLUF domain-containing protein [Tritonibacter multivorans]CUH79255.1 Blue light-and temperature-regulated antirepressor YcgF [Tritonibacter multivorans]SFC13046.1 Sensors of blue-light using FAD [Tritonibacter multivorans]